MQNPPQGSVESHCPQGQGQGIAQADVRPANTKAQLQPEIEKHRHKKPVRQRSGPGAQGAQKSVNCAADGSQRKPQAQAQKGLPNHPNNRRVQLRDLGSA